MTAVQLNLETEGFVFRKWGGEQRCKAGDWIVDREGDVYVVDREVFARTYGMVSLGVYEKTGDVWAEVAASAGKIRTNEGFSDYAAGAMLVYNAADRTDGYAMSREKFERLYEMVE